MTFAWITVAKLGQDRKGTTFLIWHRWKNACLTTFMIWASIEREHLETHWSTPRIFINGIDVYSTWSTVGCWHPNLGSLCLSHRTFVFDGCNFSWLLQATNHSFIVNLLWCLTWRFHMCFSLDLQWPPGYTQNSLKWHVYGSVLMFFPIWKVTVSGWI